MTFFLRLLAISTFFLVLVVASVRGQWTNRYPKISNVSHHVYLEGYNLPTLNQGATDPAVSPDGQTLVFAARGWLWLMNLETREAQRLTRGGIDSRPAWSPDSKQIAFVRDDTKDTNIVLFNLASRNERVLVNSAAIDLDPAFSSDGRSIFYSSAEAGDLDLWRVDVVSGERKRLTTDRGQELQPLPLAGDAQQLLYIAKTGNVDAISILDLRDNTKRVLREEGISAQMRLALNANSFAANFPAQSRYQMFLSDAKNSLLVQTAFGARYPLMPAWSAARSEIFYAEPDENEQFRVFKISAAGGAAEDVTPVSWNWGETTNRVTIRTRRIGETANLPVRLSIVDQNGHPVLPDKGQPRFDGQNGQVFFYSPGVATIEVPAGEIRILAAHGFNTVPVEVTRRIERGSNASIDLELPAPLWNGASEGWYSADLHSHLNYGGPYLLHPEDIVLDMRAEALDLATPQLANLHTRFIDTEWWGWRRTELPLIHFAQEVRSHFLGHIGVVGADALYNPWYYGPGYPVYDKLDLSNASALQFARKHGGINSYVHPVSGRDPFPKNADPAGLPLELVPDAVAGDVDTLEIACLWSDELGTSEAWYRLLNLGIPVMPSAGSDTMHNFYRTMAIGSTRIYVKPNAAMNLPNFLDAVRDGHSFVTNGPMIEFTVDNVEPGAVINNVAGQVVEWKANVSSVVPVEKLEIIVNGQIAWSGKALDAAGQKKFSGKFTAPSGGWIAARVYGGATKPPLMDSYPFAHAAPIWFKRVGSSEPIAARRSAQDLLRWMNVAEKRLNEGYAGANIQNLQKRFADARQHLETLAK